MRIVMAVCSLLACTSLSWAADIAPSPYPAPAPVYAPPPPSPPYNWTSVYVGANAGFGFATATANATGGGVTASASENLTGFIGGGQVGANYQAGWAVFGLEADLDYADQSNTTVVGGVSETDKIDYFGTLRGRFGVAIDRFLPYVTAGGGWGGASSTITAPGLSATGSNSRFVWTAGAGLEVGITQNLSARIEYLYLDTGTYNAATVGAVNVTGRVQDNLIRAGLNLRLPL